jgi:hypothetical protein
LCFNSLNCIIHTLIFIGIIIVAKSKTRLVADYLSQIDTDPDTGEVISSSDYTDSAISGLISSAPDALNTLDELAAAINDDAGYYTTITNALATKYESGDDVSLGSATFTGDVLLNEATPFLRLQENSAGAKRLDLSVNNSAQAKIEANQSASTMIFNVSSSEALRLNYNANGAVFNEGGVDRDFRIESNDKSHMFYLDAGNNRIGINDSTPYATFDVTHNGVDDYIMRIDGASNYQGWKIASSTDYGNGTVIIENVTAPGSGTANGWTWFKNNGTIGSGGATRHSVKIDGYVDIGQATTLGEGLVVKQGAVINDDGADYDFRIESTGSTHMVYVDGGNSRLGIRNSSPEYTLDVVGDIAMAAATAIVGKDGTGGDTQLLYWNGNTAYWGRSSLGGSVDQHEFRTGGTTRLSVKLGGEVGLSTNVDLQTNSSSTSSTTQAAIYTFSATDYTGAKLTVCVTDSTATERYITELLVTHDGTTAVSTEYGQVATNTALAAFDVDIVSGNVRVLATPASSNSMTFKVMSTQLL